MRLQHSSFLLLPTMLLSACSDGAPVVERALLAPVAQQSFTGTDVTITDNGDGTLTFATTEAEFTATAVSTPSSDNITTYFTPFGARTNMAALIAETDDVRAVVVLNENGFNTVTGMSVAPGFGGSIERMTETSLPSQGEVEYTGAYLSRLARNPSLPAQNYVGTVGGSLSLIADFAGGEVSGTITDRVDSINRTYEDIIIGGGTISADGTFTGIVTGGELTNDGQRTIATAGTGNYTAIFGGANGENIVGGLVLSHDSQFGSLTPDSYTEIGVFHAEQ